MAAFVLWLIMAMFLAPMIWGAAGLGVSFVLLIVVLLLVGIFG